MQIENNNALKHKDSIKNLGFKKKNTNKNNKKEKKKKKGD